MTRDLILTGARVVTMDPATPLAQAVAIRDGRILAVGSDHDILAALPGAERIDAGGRLVLPGFIDAHVHLLDGGTDLAFSAQLHEVQTVEEMLSVLAATAAWWWVDRGRRHPRRTRRSVRRSLRERHG